MLPRLLGSTIRIRVSTELGAHVLASRAGLEQILLNLAVNARDAMPEGGEFDIGLRCTEDEVILSTSDTGIGMDAATQERIFEPFFTTKVMGTGLGLATVRQLVSSFQGSIELESAPDRGTTFRVRFARSDEVPAVEARSRSERPPVSASLRRRILLVEDDPLVRRGLTRSLEHQGYEVIPTLDGAEALGLLSSGAHIDVVVSDIAMPRVDGDQLAEALAERHPRLPVVLLSGNRSPRVDPAPLGRVFLEKPVDARVLVKTIEDLIAAQRCAPGPSPGRIGPQSERAVRVARIFGDLGVDPLRSLERFIFGRQLELGDDESVVVAVKLVDFPGVSAEVHQVTRLVEHDRAQLEHLTSVVEGHLVLELGA